MELQRFRFQSIDLSHNKLVGSVNQMTGLSAYPTAVSGSNLQLVLEVNRLTGVLPPSFEDMYGIDVLNGNVFQCTNGYGNSGLPKHDPSSGTYICGADELNRAMIAVASVAFAIGSVIIAILCFSGRFIDSIRKYPKIEKLLMWMRSECSLLNSFISKIALVLQDVDRPSHAEKHRNILEFIDSLTLLRRISNGILLVCIFGCLPVYLLFYSLTDQFSTHRDKYSWISTSVFLTGDFPAAILSFLWLVCCLLTVYMIARRFRQKGVDWKRLYNQWSDLFRRLVGLPALEGSYERVSYFERYGAATMSSRPSDLQQDSSASFQSDLNGRLSGGSSQNDASQSSKKTAMFVAKEGFLRLLCITTVFALNGVFAIVVNAVYVSIQSSDSVTSSTKILCQMLMAGVKLFMNMVIVKSLVARLAFGKAKAKLHVSMLVFNSLVAPCVATALTDSSCFMELFTGSGTICSSYEFKACLEANQELTLSGKYETICTSYSYPSFVVEFNPAFTYNYDCGSAILRAYIPVFIYTYLFLGLFSPMAYFAAAAIPSKYLHPKVVDGIDAVLRPRDYLQSELGNVSARKFIQAGSIQALLVHHITILLTFGLNSPVLALTIALAIFVITYMWQYLLFRFMRTCAGGDSAASRLRSESSTIDVVLEKGSISEYNIAMNSPLIGNFAGKERDSNVSSSSGINVYRESDRFSDVFRSSWMKETEGETTDVGADMWHNVFNSDNKLLMGLSNACGRTWYTAKHCMWHVFYCSFTFYGFILFDIIGDSHGLTDAISAPILLFVVCIFLRLFTVDIIIGFSMIVSRMYL